MVSVEASPLGLTIPTVGRDMMTGVVNCLVVSTEICDAKSSLEGTKGGRHAKDQNC